MHSTLPSERKFAKFCRGFWSVQRTGLSALICLSQETSSSTSRTSQRLQVNEHTPLNHLILLSITFIAFSLFACLAFNVLCHWCPLNILHLPAYSLLPTSAPGTSFSFTSPSLGSEASQTVGALKSDESDTICYLADRRSQRACFDCGKLSKGSCMILSGGERVR